ncbi:MAG: hypothetical protein RI973_2318 [Bacteroidota bacterium]|jgi:hypothetical protein
MTKPIISKIKTLAACLSMLLPASLSSQVNLSSSNLPILVINTDNNAPILDEPKIAAHLGVIWNPNGQTNHITDPFNDYDGKIGIEIRGSSSQGFEKKNYAMETWNPDNSSSNVSLLGLPEENDWVLHGPYSDKSLVRNAITYTLAGWIMDYAPRVRFCEVVINGNYRGVYILTEKIKRDKNRVDISELNPDEISGDDLTGGYIIKFDKWDGAFSDGFQSLFPPYPGAGGNVYYQYHYPQPDEITPEQKTYIKNFINNVEFVLQGANFADSLEGYPKYFDVPSLMHYMFIQEIGRNVDGYRLSTYLHKDKDSKDGRLKAGPIWDFNLAYGNVDYCIGPGTNGWAIRFNDFCPSDAWSIQFWWMKLFDEPRFKKDICTRWKDLRATTLSDDRVFHLLDSLETMLQQPAQRNFQRWNILGNYVWPNAFVGGSYYAEFNYLRNWLTQRLAWMDQQWDDCQSTDTNDVVSKDKLLVYPNPSDDQVVFEFQKAGELPIAIQIFNAQGQAVRVLKDDKGASSGSRKVVWEEPVPAGIYFYKAEIGQREILEGKVVRF